MFLIVIGTDCKSALSGYCWLINRNTGHNAIKIGVLEFFGIKPVKISVFSGIKSSDDIKRKKWFKEVMELGENQNNNKKVFSIFN